MDLIELTVNIIIPGITAIQLVAIIGVIIQVLMMMVMGLVILHIISPVSMVL